MVFDTNILEYFGNCDIVQQCERKIWANINLAVMHSKIPAFHFNVKKASKHFSYTFFRRFEETKHFFLNGSIEIRCARYFQISGLL